MRELRRFVEDKDVTIEALELVLEALRKRNLNLDEIGLLLDVVKTERLLFEQGLEELEYQRKFGSFDKV